ncbi:spore germination protein [Priestia megaterium]|uniref:spore germination protein n=1 Tax=Priestia megaterium TaxID=1404 RepID=UPI0037098E1C
MLPALLIPQPPLHPTILSPPILIILSITPIPTFPTPSFNIPISPPLIPFFFIIAAAIFPFYPIILSLLMILLHFSTLTSFPIPYISPFPPFTLLHNPHTLLTLPSSTFTQTPPLLTTNTLPQPPNQQPPPPPSPRIVNPHFQQPHNHQP